MKINNSLKQNFIIRNLRFLYYKMKIRSSENKVITRLIKWRDLNKHNYTCIGNGVNDSDFPINLIQVGKGTYGTLTVSSFGVGDEGLIIGDYCSIAPGVRFVLGGEHSMEKITTYPFERIYVDTNSEELFFSKGKIVVENDVWIGSNVLILSGVTLRQGTVVAAGSVVTKSTEPYSVVGGNPARFIKKRFAENIISILLSINISDIDIDFIKSNIDILKQKVDDSSINLITQRLDKYIKK